MQYTQVQSLAEMAGQRDATPEDEWALRVKLAGTYRLFAHLGWDSTIFGHITVRVPGTRDHFLINPFGLRFDEVTASNLVKIDAAGRILEPSEHPVNPAGFYIHSAIHMAREDAHCVMHTHTQAGMALSATQARIESMDFAGAALHHRVAYHPFAGVHADFSDCPALVANLGAHNCLMLENHGMLSCGPTLARAFQRLGLMETACRVQVAARATNVPPRLIPDEVAERHARVIDGDDGELAFTAMIRLMAQKDDSFCR